MPGCQSLLPLGSLSADPCSSLAFSAALSLCCLSMVPVGELTLLGESGGGVVDRGKGLGLLAWLDIAQYQTPALPRVKQGFCLESSLVINTAQGLLA